MKGECLLKKLFSAAVLICSLIFLSGGMSISAEDDFPPAKAYVLMECSTGKILREENSRERLSAGTAAKLMTALLAGEKIEKGEWQTDTVLTASDCVNGTKGAVIWLVQGEKMTAEDLLKGLIIGNANDAAAVLAEGISGSREDFTQEMNLRAAELGMADTYFASPDGFDDDESYSTAYDIGLLSCRLSELVCLEPYFTTWRDFLRDGATELVNENTFARTYDGIKGFKAWHSENAGFCISACAERDGMKCAAVVLGCDYEESRFDAASALLKEAFRGYTLTLPGFSSEFMKPVKVKGGVSGSVDTEAKNLSDLVVPKSDTSLKAVIILPEYVTAPVAKGRKIGSIAFYNGDTLLLETALTAKENVEALTIESAAVKLLVKLCKL